MTIPTCVKRNYRDREQVDRRARGSNILRRNRIIGLILKIPAPGAGWSAESETGKTVHNLSRRAAIRWLEAEAGPALAM